jgi:hypothetical protein
MSTRATAPALPAGVRARTANVRRRLLLVTALLTLILLCFGAAGASARQFLPPPGKVFAGVTDKPVSAYQLAVGKHPPVYQEFAAWGQYLPSITHDAIDAHARMMMAITTAHGSSEAITPGQIARGQGDDWLIGLHNQIYTSGNVTYVRLMGEMDAYWNDYSAYNADGSSRGPDHSTAAYKRAWKRIALIMRGGILSAIDDQLKRLGMPALRTSSDLPKPKVAMLWVPQTAGAPDISGNQPRDYYPGGQWVDWVGTDFYSKFPNFSGLDRFYGAFTRKPFVFGEYALWGSDDPGWVDQLFSWVRSHGRTRMLIYNQGAQSDGPFRLSHYPAAATALRRALASPAFPPYAPEWAP